MNKMEGIAVEVSQKLKSAIKAKLMELGAYVDEELPNYVMVMVTNRRSKAEMDRELNLFLGGNTATFTTWLQSVWMKLEQVTVSNLGSEKRKQGEKKKKVKKSVKSSSESEEDRKHKKKRKASASTDSKESKKRKSLKSDISENEIDYFTKENCEDEFMSGKRLQQSSKKNGARSNSELDSDAETNESILNVNKKSKDGSIDEDDFLNIKEDFESEFLSDEELGLKGKIKALAAETSSKKSQKIELAPHKSNEEDRAPPPVQEKKHTVMLGGGAGDSGSIEKANKLDGISKPNEKIIKDNKENKNVENIKENETRPSKTVSKTIIIRDRRLAKKPSRSRSRSASKSRRTRSRSPLELRRSRSRSKSRPTVSRRSPSRSPSQSRSRSVSPFANNVIKLKEKSAVLDARELINRKRAMLHGGSSKEEKPPLRRQFTIRNDADGEEDERRDKLPDTTNKQDKNSSDAKFSRVIRNKGDKRGLQDEESYTTASSRNRNDKIDLRKIKRTVYVNNEDSDNENNDEKAKIHKSVVNQIVKYIKEEPVVSSSVSKPTKISRTKITTVQSASSTLIRKAVLDAHKSLTSNKEDLTKKKELAEARYKNSRSKSSPETSKKKVKKENSVDEVQVISPDTSVPEENEDDDGDTKNTNEEAKSQEQQETEVEEYDPSQSMPQFVVTLTGLDPKLYPEDMELNELNEENDQDMEEKSKPKIQEQCKYFPNCLAGDKCLFHHPTIPCKMFPNCKYGTNCLYLHPKCKFDAACTRYDCPFLHTASRMTNSVPVRHMNPATTINAQPCKFYYNCVNPVCPFQHPKICRFDRFCTNKNCTFQHTSLSHVSTVSKDKLKWSRPKSETEEGKMENAVAAAIEN